MQRLAACAVAVPIPFAGRCLDVSGFFGASLNLFVMHTGSDILCKTLWCRSVAVKLVAAALVVVAAAAEVGVIVVVAELMALVIVFVANLLHLKPVMLVVYLGSLLLLVSFGCCWTIAPLLFLLAQVPGDALVLVEYDEQAAVGYVVRSIASVGHDRTTHSKTAGLRDFQLKFCQFFAASLDAVPVSFSDRRPWLEVPVGDAASTKRLASFLVRVLL